MTAKSTSITSLGLLDLILRVDPRQAGGGKLALAGGPLSQALHNRLFGGGVLHQCVVVGGLDERGKTAIRGRADLRLGRIHRGLGVGELGRRLEGGRSLALAWSTVVVASFKASAAAWVAERWSTVALPRASRSVRSVGRLLSAVASCRRCRGRGAPGCRSGWSGPAAAVAGSPGRSGRTGDPAGSGHIGPGRWPGCAVPGPDLAGAWSRRYGRCGRREADQNAPGPAYCLPSLCSEHTHLPITSLCAGSVGAAARNRRPRFRIHRYPPPMRGAPIVVGEGIAIKRNRHRAQLARPQFYLGEALQLGAALAGAGSG